MAEPKHELRYDVQAIEFMETLSDRFYEIWLELATERANEHNRLKVLREDADETLLATFERLKGEAKQI